MECIPQNKLVKNLVNSFLMTYVHVSINCRFDKLAVHNHRKLMCIKLTLAI